MIRGFFSGLALSLSLAVVPQAQADGRLSNVGMVRDNVNNILDNSSSHELIVSALVEFRNVHGGQGVDNHLMNQLELFFSQKFATVHSFCGIGSNGKTITGIIIDDTWRIFRDGSTLRIEKI